MIEFVFGREPSSKTEYVIAKMKEPLSDGKKCVLIIPEQQALFWDRTVATSFDPTDAFNIESVSFKRLANNVFRKFGGVAKQYINDARKSLLMWSAINSVSDRLKVYRATDREDRYVPLMLMGVHEAKLYGISPEELMEVSEKMESAQSSLPARLHDLALISAAYETLLRTSYDDPEEIPDALCKTLESCNYFSNTAVFVDSFYTLTPKEIKVMRHIFSQSSDVLMTFAMTGADSEKMHMEYVSSYMKEMARTASRLGLDVKKTEIPDKRKKEFSYLSASLWDYGAAPLSGECDCVTVVKCADRYDEASLAAARIKELVSNGSAFGDIACVCADFESLRGITDIELERQGIPVYVSGKPPVTSQPALRLLLSCISVIAGGWRREDIISCARTGLCSLSPDEADALEMYTDTWRIRGKKKYCSGPWEMNADGYTDAFSSWGSTLLSLANSAKEKLIPPIEAFSESFPSTVKEVCTAAYKLLCDFSVYDHLKKEVSLLEKAGKFAEAQRKSQVWNAVCEVLDTLAASVPDATVDARRFAALLKNVADTCYLGTIPDGIDRVALGSVGSVRTDSVKHLIILGAKSGEFPRVARETGFFSDNDKDLLTRAGLEISPNTVSKQKEELFRFQEAVSSPKESITLFIPSDGKDNHPSLGALRVMKLIPGAKVFDFTGPDGEKIIRTGGRTDLGYSEGELSADLDRTTGAALTRLFDKNINLTQSRIERFNSCPFSYYCRYILDLDEGGAAQFRQSEVGNFVHSVLEHFMKEAALEKAFPLSEDLVVSKTERLIKEACEKVLPPDADGYVTYMLNRLSKSVQLFTKALNEEFAQSRFSPHSFELKVGFSDDLPAIPIRLDNGHDLTVRGIVDRMDILRENGNVYIRVVDYKTGHKKFSLDKVLKGENIQLLLYLFSLCNMPKDCGFAKELCPEGESLVPAGAVYFSACPGEAESSELLDGEDAEAKAIKDISRTGIVLGDKELIEAMDSELSGRFSPAYVNKKGEIKGSFAKDTDDFNKIKAALDDFLCRTGNRLTGGEAYSSPSAIGQNSPCKYCAMKPVCRHDDHTINNSMKGGNEDE